MRGRKPKPSRLRIVGGNAGRRPINTREPKPAIAAPSAPAVLRGEARREWRRVVPMLEAMGVLAAIDRAALAAYCQSYGRWLDAERELRRAGLTFETDKGNHVQSPLVGIARRAMADVVRYSAEFGMTPSARSRVQADPNRIPQAQERPTRKYF
jgi:P27 family predicted phage terminase small subunit